MLLEYNPEINFNMIFGKYLIYGYNIIKLVGKIKGGNKLKYLNHIIFAAIIMVILSVTMATKSQANGLEVDFDKPFEVEISELSQYYNFEINKAGRLEIALDAKEYSYATLGILKDGTLVESKYITNSEANSSSTYYTYDLPAGSYSLVFTGNYNNHGHYKVGLDFTAIETDEILPNNTFNQAQQIDLKQTVNGYVDFVNGVDYYKFTLDKPAVVNVGIEGYLKNYTSFQLLDSEKNLFFNKYDSSSYSESALMSNTVRLNPGDYYIAVYSKDDYSTGKYKLKLNVEEVVNTEKEPNNGVSSAHKVLFGSKVNAFLAENDSIDYFTFNVAKKGSYQIHLKSALIFKTYYKILDEDYNTIASGTKDSSVDLPQIYKEDLFLTPGTYYVAVYFNREVTHTVGEYELTVLGDGITKFKDFSLGAYWTTPFAWGFGKNVINGDTSTMKLNPNGQINESQWLAMLLRYAYDIKDSTKGKWYDSYYAKAKEIGLQVSNKPTSKLTRAQVAQMLATVTEAKAMTEQEAVAWMFYKGLTTGVNAAEGATYENFNPKGNMTRAHAVTFMYRLFEEQ